MLDVVCSVFTEHCPLSVSTSSLQGCRSAYRKNFQPTHSVLHVRALNEDGKYMQLTDVTGIDTNKVNRLQVLVGETSLVDGDTKLLGVSCSILLLSQSVADAVFISSNHCSVTQSSVVCASIHSTHDTC